MALSGAYIFKNGKVLTESSDGNLMQVAEKSELPLKSTKEVLPSGSKKATGNTPVEEALFAARFETAKSKGCAPLEIHFKDQSVRAQNYHWDFGNGKTSALPNPTITYEEPGKYRAILTVTSAHGDKASYRKEIEVLRNPSAAFDIDLENSHVANRKVVFTNQSEGASEYLWDFGDNENSTNPSPEHVYNDYGKYTVKLIAKAHNGCTDTVELLSKFIEKNYSLMFPLNFRPKPYDRGNNGYYEKAGGETGVFYPLNNGVKEYQLHIYAPNGIEVFSTTNIKQGWNGYLKGRLAPAGMYHYEATGIYPNGEPFLISGRVRVIVEEYY
jgi:chitodextrinase